MPFDMNDPDTKTAVEAMIAEATGGLKTKVDELIGDNKKLKADLRKTQDINPDDLAKLETENDKLRGELTTAQKVAKEATSAAEKSAKALDAESGFTKKLLIENGLKDTLIKGGVKDEDFLDALVTKFSQGAAVVVDGEIRKAMLGDKELGVVVTEYLGSDAGKKFVAAPSNGGGGAPGGRGGGGSPKTMTREQFGGLDPAGQMAFSKEGGKVVDQAA
jgi:regulator of replication initiation timing